MSRYSSPRPIAEDDDTSSFDSGEPSLDEYLRKRALGNHVQGASRCFVTCRDGRVVGYYALASASVQHGHVTGKVRRNMPDPVPVILLSRLAVDRKEQGSGVGKNLLRDAILRSVAASEIIGVRALLVHAVNDAARAFYAHFDFEPSPTDPLHLLLLIKDARSAVGEQQAAWTSENQRIDAQEPHLRGVDPAAVGVALAWVEDLRVGDIGALWSRTSHDYRLALTQWWMTADPGVCGDPVVAGNGQWLVTGLNCVAVPGWPPTWPPVTASFEDLIRVTQRSAALQSDGSSRVMACSATRQGMGNRSPVPQPKFLLRSVVDAGELSLNGAADPLRNRAVVVSGAVAQLL